jgi:deoxyribose-phosphate aldolase
MDRENLSQIVNEVVARVVRRLEDTTHGELPTPADERMFAERRARLAQAIERGAARLTPQALPLEHCFDLDLAPRIELALLGFDTREMEVREACREAVARGFASVCVALDFAEAAASELRGSAVRLCVPVGFPTGGFSIESKTGEVRSALAAGADEIDAVMALAKLREADFNGVVTDLRAIVRAAQKRRVKAVVELASLTREQKIAAAILAKAGGACFVKSSTGFGPDAATVGDLALIRAALDGQPPPPEAPESATRIGAVVSIEISPGRWKEKRA